MRRPAKSNVVALGFTLIEVLVVLAILGLLAAVLFPVFASVRRRGQQTACLGNLRQLHLACALYAQDNGGLLPPYTSTVLGVPGNPLPGCVETSALLLASLRPYTHSTDVWRCPADTFKPVPGQTVGCGPHGSVPFPDLTSYNYKGYRYTSTGVGPLPMDYYNGVGLTTSTRVLLMDTTSCPQEFTYYAAYNHGGRWNRIYLDGHAKSYSLDCTNFPMITETP